jgi:glucan biosynthesis protein C
MENINRRYDIDWLRVIAIAMLLIYHTAIGVQSWGLMIGFITNKQSWNGLWTPMSMLNVWRIPLLFFVSGMGVYFAIQKRDWKQLLKERAKRILLPFVFGMLCIVPIHILLLQNYYGWELSYKPSPSHLWFLANIFIYTFVLLPIFFYINKYKDKKILIKLRSIIAHPLGLLLVILLFITEAIIVNPNPYELYAMTTHGFVLGLLAFICGYLFMYSGAPFWDMICKWRWIFIVSALALYIYRTYQGYHGQFQVPLYRLSIESSLWIFSVFAFGYKHLNKNSKALKYLSQSTYPIYIIHMMFIYLASYLVFPLDIDVRLKYSIVVVFLFVGSFAFYELFIRRIALIRPLFGLKK